MADSERETGKSIRNRVRELEDRAIAISGRTRRGLVKVVGVFHPSVMALQDIDDIVCSMVALIDQLIKQAENDVRKAQDVAARQVEEIGEELGKEKQIVEDMGEALDKANHCDKETEDLGAALDDHNTGRVVVASYASSFCKRGATISISRTTGHVILSGVKSLDGSSDSVTMAVPCREFVNQLETARQILEHLGLLKVSLLGKLNRIEDNVDKVLSVVIRNTTILDTEVNLKVPQYNKGVKGIAELILKEEETKEAHMSAASASMLRVAVNCRDGVQLSLGSRATANRLHDRGYGYISKNEMSFRILNAGRVALEQLETKTENQGETETEEEPKIERQPEDPGLPYVFSIGLDGNQERQLLESALHGDDFTVMMEVPWEVLTAHRLGKRGYVQTLGDKAFRITRAGRDALEAYQRDTQ